MSKRRNSSLTSSCVMTFNDSRRVLVSLNCECLSIVDHPKDVLVRLFQRRPPLTLPLEKVRSVNLNGSELYLEADQTLKLDCMSPEDGRLWLDRIRSLCGREDEEDDDDWSDLSSEDEEEVQHQCGHGEARRRVRPIDDRNLNEASLVSSGCLGCTRLAPTLFIGGRMVASDRASLCRRGITHVLNMACECENYFQADRDFSYMHCRCTDKSGDDVTPHLDDITLFVHDAWMKGGKVLIHCNSGISRSSAAVLACLLRWGSPPDDDDDVARTMTDEMSSRMTLLDAFKWLKERRPIASPHPVYMRQLCEYEVKLRGGKTTVNHNTYNNNRYELPEKLHPSIDDPRSSACLLGGGGGGGSGGYHHCQSPVYAATPAGGGHRSFAFFAPPRSVAIGDDQ